MFPESGEGRFRGVQTSVGGFSPFLLHPAKEKNDLPADRDEHQRERGEGPYLSLVEAQQKGEGKRNHYFGGGQSCQRKDRQPQQLV